MLQVRAEMDARAAALKAKAAAAVEARHTRAACRAREPTGTALRLADAQGSFMPSPYSLSSGSQARTEPEFWRSQGTRQPAPRPMPH